jgi:TM2 domain-containing membrane protein YozV
VSQEWYYSVGGDRQGPVSAADLKKLADAGTLSAADLVWKDGMADWVAARSIKGLFPASATAPAASKSGEQAAARARPAADTDDDRPARPRRRDDDEDEDDRPSRRGRDEEDDDERPPRGRRRDEGEEDDDRPVRRRDEDGEDEDDDRPRKKRRRVPEDTGSRKMTAGLLGILIGWTGAHRFYLGDTAGGLIRLLVLNLVCAGGIVGLIEGIIYLTKSDEDFYREYIVEQKGWF